MHTFKLYRYDPDVDAKPCMQTLELEVNPDDRMLLDVLMRLKAMDPSLSFRRSCREGICGSDAMNINGKNGLACVTNMKSLPRVVTLKPLPGLPVMRDLIVDMTDFFKQYHSIKPYLINPTPPPGARTPAVDRAVSRARRGLRMHPVCLLFISLSELLVEPGQIRRAGGIAAGLSLSRRQSGHGHL